MREGRWVTVTESEFEHERRGLEAIRERLPDSDPWRAWSNFTFTANTGHVREVDLLVVAPGGVYMIELKDWHGSVTSENGTWVQTTPGGRRRTHGNPLHLVNKKAKELAGLLGQGQGRAAGACGSARPSASPTTALRVRLPAHDQNGVYTVDRAGRDAGAAPARRAAPRSPRPTPAQIKTGAGPDRHPPQRRRVQGRPVRAGAQAPSTPARPGPTTWPATASCPSAPASASTCSERGSDASLRQSVENAARREAAVLQRFRHPGVVQLQAVLPVRAPGGPRADLRLRPADAEAGRVPGPVRREAGHPRPAWRWSGSSPRPCAPRTPAASTTGPWPPAPSTSCPVRAAARGQAVGEEAAWLSPQAADLRLADRHPAQRATPPRDGARRGWRRPPCPRCTWPTTPTPTSRPS